MQYDTCEKRADDVLVLPLAEQKTVLSIGSLSYRDNPALVVLLGGATTSEAATPPASSESPATQS